MLLTKFRLIYFASIDFTLSCIHARIIYAGLWLDNISLKGKINLRTHRTSLCDAIGKNVCKNNSKSIRNSIESDRAERIRSAFQTSSRLRYTTVVTNFSLESWKTVDAHKFLKQTINSVHHIE